MTKAMDGMIKVNYINNTQFIRTKVERAKAKEKVANMEKDMIVDTNYRTRAKVMASSILEDGNGITLGLSYAIS